MGSSQTVCLVAAGLHSENLRLQPWRYLQSVAHGLAARGFQVHVVTDAPDGLPAAQQGGPVTYHCLPSVRAPRWPANRPLRALLERLEPDVQLWHCGLVALLYQRPLAAGKVVAIFTSPVYSFSFLRRLGLPRLLRGWRLAGLHLFGSLIPRPLLRIAVRGLGVSHWVVQTEDTRRALLALGVPPAGVQVIPPGVDPAWQAAAAAPEPRARRETTIVYLGAPAELRGLPILLHAFKLAQLSRPELRLRLLCRTRPGEPDAAAAALAEVLPEALQRAQVQVVNEVLPLDELVRQVAAGDLVALPFLLVPSDAPLSVLEAAALGKPVITTRVACLPELAAGGRAYLAEPGDAPALAAALLRAADDQQPPAAPPLSRTWEAVASDWAGCLEALA